ncbi:toll/interleukin-1 receptor domain-containing protein [Desulfoluna spongiiphila]|uniref:toll/interleukin-1 receptor domain-containing protein n=1 Tax=Desulfoluna spongiiphila TaxID=419481 RepID=UPI001258DBBE|nr:toll/interleukin-1 receptor domain-containing protein [Desulfoluna spongiiphila]VVS91426.1 toll/interleukin-1 receptor homology (tir) domain [Desulfoluna spongiiphila]
MDVFVSHITEESEIAKSMKEWIESTFLGQHEVFVSSDSKSIPAGTKWLDEITKAITSSKILLLLCSPDSIHRPWINFEAGCGWAKAIPVIPICYGGLNKGELPPPINALQALDFNEELPEKLFQALITHLKIARLPRINYGEMFNELEIAIEKRTITPKHIPSDSLTSNKSENKLSDEQIKILDFLAKANRYVELPQIAQQTQLNPQRVEFYLEKLSDSEYIHASYNTFEPTSYNLDYKGREVLFGMGLI